jgi:hypothetical protein
MTMKDDPLPHESGPLRTAASALDAAAWAVTSRVAAGEGGSGDVRRLSGIVPRRFAGVTVGRRAARVAHLVVGRGRVPANGIGEAAGEACRPSGGIGPCAQGVVRGGL